MASSSVLEAPREGGKTLQDIFLANVGDDNVIPVPKFRGLMEENRSALSAKSINAITAYMDQNKDGFVSLNEIRKLENESAEKIAKLAGVKASQVKLFRKGVSFTADIYLPNEEERQKYRDRYTCCPPPLFLPIISVVQVALYIYYSNLSNDWIFVSNEVVSSPLTYLPNKRQEAWRFLSYMLVHGGLEHILFNVIMQLLLGIPLEMVHGSIRVTAIYIGGVIAGSLATSVFDSEVALVGGSGGVYALLAAHIANVVINGDVMNKVVGVIRVFVVLLLLGFDFGYAAYKRFDLSVSGGTVAFTAHVAGALTGVTLGLVVLKNFKKAFWEKVFFVIALVAFVAFIIFAVFWNIFWPEFPPTEY